MANSPLAAPSCLRGTSWGIRLEKQSNRVASAAAATAIQASTTGVLPPKRRRCRASSRVQPLPTPLAINITRRRGHSASRRPSTGSTSSLASCTAIATAAKVASCSWRW